MASVIRGSDNFDSLVHQGIGVNQTWQDVTASRSAGVTYTNTTGKPIYVSIKARSTGAGAILALTVNGIEIGHITASASNVYHGGQVTAVVPNGVTYSYYNVACDQVLMSELR